MRYSQHFLELDFAAVMEESIQKRDVSFYQSFLSELGYSNAYDYQMQLVMNAIQDGGFCFTMMWLTV